MLNPDFSNIHYHLAITYSHLAELLHEPDLFHKSLHHYRIANQKEKENDQIILEWGITLSNFADLLENDGDSESLFREAEYKLIQAAKLGNIYAYYALASLYALTHQYDRAMHFPL